jgi:anthranilate phosphoribosyltransferase
MASPADLSHAKPAIAMRSFIQRIATGPEMSKDLSRAEARQGMQLILDQQVDPVQMAIFLIALRMKRETDEENLGVLEALLENTHSAIAPVDEVLTLTDPHNGYVRILPASPFLPAVLAACGVPTVSQGLESVGPKFGVTHRHVLQAAGAHLDLPPEAAALRVADTAIGWAYVDQRWFCPKLHDLVHLRTLIVKRSVITTAEVIPQAVRGRRRNHLLTGYVHRPYPPIYAMLARRAGYDSALLVRGVEGGVIPSLRQPATVFHYHDGGDEQALTADPTVLGIDQPVRAVPLPEGLPETDQPEDDVIVSVDTSTLAKAAAEAGLEALAGKPGPTRDSLVYGGAVCLHHLGRYGTLAAAADAVRSVLNSGLAARHFRA